MSRRSPSFEEVALVVAALSAYGQHVRRLPPLVAFDLAGAAFRAHAQEDWRKETVLVRVLETFDRLHYEARRKAS